VRGRLVLHDCSALHHQRNVFQHLDMLQRVFGHGDKVGVMAHRERADIVGATDQIGGVPGGCLDRLRRGHPIHHHVVKLLRVVAVRIDAGIGAKGHLDSRPKALRKFSRCSLPRLRSLSRNSCGIPKFLALPIM